MPELPVVGDAPSKAAGGAKNVLTKKVGPLPVWGYAVALGAGLLALRLVHGGGSSSSTSAGVGGGSTGAAGAGGNPAGSGANLVPPADTGPRQSPVGADTAAPIPVLISNYYPTTYTAPAYTAPSSRTIPSTTTLIPTAEVQPPAPAPFIAPMLTDAGLYNISGVNYSLSAEGLARAAKGVPNVGAPVGAAPVSSPTGPSVPSAPVQAPAPGTRFEG